MDEGHRERGTERIPSRVRTVGAEPDVEAVRSRPEPKSDASLTGLRRHLSAQIFFEKIALEYFPFPLGKFLRQFGGRKCVSFCLTCCCPQDHGLGEKENDVGSKRFAASLKALLHVKWYGL